MSAIDLAVSNAKKDYDRAVALREAYSTLNKMQGELGSFYSSASSLMKEIESLKSSIHYQAYPAQAAKG